MSKQCSIRTLNSIVNMGIGYTSESLGKLNLYFENQGLNVTIRLIQNLG